MNPFHLLTELERFDLPARRKTVMRALIFWQIEFGLDQLRVDGQCAALARLCAGERSLLARNHVRTELSALERDGMILLKQDAGALLLSIVPEPAMWRCSQIIDHLQWLSHVNRLRTQNGLQQLQFSPHQFTPNEPTLAESIADSTLSHAAHEIRPGALLGTTTSHASSDTHPSYSHHSHNRNPFPLQESQIEVPTTTRALVKRLNVSTVNRDKYQSRLTVERTTAKQSTENFLMAELLQTLGSEEMERSGGHWRVDHVRPHPRVTEEMLAELRYKMRTGFVFRSCPAAWLEGAIRKTITRANP